MFFRAVKRLEASGCDSGYSSPAVDPAHQSLESVIHELAHAVVAGIALEPNPPRRSHGKRNAEGLTQLIGKRITCMPEWCADNNEEITLAVGMLVLEELGIKYRYRDFIKGADWKTNRDHDKYVRDALLRPTTRKHARRIINYLHRIDRLPPEAPDVRPTQVQL